MPATIEDLQAQEADIIRRMSGGITGVRSGDMQVTYDNTNLSLALTEVRQQLATLRGTGLGTRMSFIRVGMRRA
jgi:hypothetical protein